MFEFQSYVIFTPLLRFFFSNSYAYTSEFQPRSGLAVRPKSKTCSQKKYHHTSYRSKNSKKKKCITGTMVRLNYEVCSA